MPARAILDSKPPASPNVPLTGSRRKRNLRPSESVETLKLTDGIAAVPTRAAGCHTWPGTSRKRTKVEESFCAAWRPRCLAPEQRWTMAALYFGLVAFLVLA